MVISDRFSIYILRIALPLTLIVLMLGAYTRLKDAGLGCPDWPGCYGQITVPSSAPQLLHAEFLFPYQAVDPTKAWLEMIHRYAAGTLVGLILLLLAQSIRRCHIEGQPMVLPLVILLSIFLQALLGRWTVTMKLLPIIVTAHLLGGMILFSLLSLLMVELGGYFKKIHTKKNKPFRPWITLGLIIVFLQMALGGWTSSHYAALACPDFPFCHGDVVPSLDVGDALALWSQHTSHIAQMTIQFMHRLGGLITFLYVGGLGLSLAFSNSSGHLRKWGIVLLFLVLAQVSLGILNVLLLLPSPIAVAHNGVAALLLACFSVLNYRLYANH